MRLFASALTMAAVLFAGAQVVSADYTPGRTFTAHFNRATYQDRDWNVAFYENCQLPEYSSTQWVEEAGERFLRFTLKNGQVGGCGSDNRVRHGAPYWERAELKQTTTLERNRDYRLTYRVRFVKGFDQDGEDFLQIHQSVDGCRVGPRVMLKFSGGVLLGADVPVFIDDLIGKWVDVRFDFNADDTYSLYLDGKKVIGNQLIVQISPCGEPHLKIGIYRPGDDRATGERLSVMDIDKLRLVDRK